MDLDEQAKAFIEDLRTEFGDEIRHEVRAELEMESSHEYRDHVEHARTHLKLRTADKMNKCTRLELREQFVTHLKDRRAALINECTVKFKKDLDVAVTGSLKSLTRSLGRLPGGLEVQVREVLHAVLLGAIEACVGEMSDHVLQRFDTELGQARCLDYN